MSVLGSKYPRPETDRVQVITACVANYDEMADISGVRQDWDSLEQLFTGDAESSIYKPDQFTLLKDPTIADFQSTILEYSQSRSASGDILLFYFSGHGVIFGDGEFHLCMRDTKLNGDDFVFPLSTVPMKSIIQTVSLANVIPCFILDSCFSGAVVKESEKNIGISLEMQASQTLADKYAVFASSAENSISKGTQEGGYFTNAIADTVYEGLQNMDHLPFITLENIVSSVDHQLEKIGAPLSRVRMGRGFPELRLAKNKNYHPEQSVEKFQPSYKPFLKLLWDEGDP